MFVAAFSAGVRASAKSVVRPMAARAMSTMRMEPCQADNMMQIGTRRIYNEDHDMYRESVRRFYEEEVVPNHAKWEEQGFCPPELWKAAGDAGILCVTMPEEYGGPGVDILYSSIVWEEQSYTGCTGPGWALHSEIVAPYILNYGTEEQKQQYIPGMVTGDCIGAIAMTEPGAGSDLQGVRTTAKKDGDDWILNGSKTYITNGYNCHACIVVAKTDTEAKGAHGISLFLVDADTPGFHKGQRLKKMGLKAQDTSELFFEDCRVPDSALLGGLNKGFYLLMNELPQERLLIADMAVAAAESCYELTREFVKDRKAFGRTIADLQTTKHKMAEMKTEIAVARAFVDQCLELHAAEKLDSPMASMAKYWTTDLQSKIADQCVQLHGGAGYMWEYPVCRHYVDARVQRIYGGSNEIMKELIARTV